ncbi:hypothetical protein AAMO2058_000857300 [Amorphochlora amoebiformis]
MVVLMENELNLTIPEKYSGSEIVQKLAIAESSVRISLPPDEYRIRQRSKRGAERWLEIFKQSPDSTQFAKDCLRNERSNLRLVEFCAEVLRTRALRNLNNTEPQVPSITPSEILEILMQWAHVSMLKSPPVPSNQADTEIWPEKLIIRRLAVTLGLVTVETGDASILMTALKAASKPPRRDPEGLGLRRWLRIWCMVTSSLPAVVHSHGKSQEISEKFLGIFREYSAGAMGLAARVGEGRREEKLEALNSIETWLTYIPSLPPDTLSPPVLTFLASTLSPPLPPPNNYPILDGAESPWGERDHSQNILVGRKGIFCLVKILKAWSVESNEGIFTSLMGIVPTLSNHLQEAIQRGDSSISQVDIVGRGLCAIGEWAAPMLLDSTGDCISEESNTLIKSIALVTSCRLDEDICLHGLHFWHLLAQNAIMHTSKSTHIQTWRVLESVYYDLLRRLLEVSRLPVPAKEYQRLLSQGIGSTHGTIGSVLAARGDFPEGSYGMGIVDEFKGEVVPNLDEDPSLRIQVRDTLRDTFEDCQTVLSVPVVWTILSHQLKTLQTENELDDYETWSRAETLLFFLSQAVRKLPDRLGKTAGNEERSRRISDIDEKFPDERSRRISDIDEKFPELHSRRISDIDEKFPEKFRFSDLVNPALTFLDDISHALRFKPLAPSLIHTALEFVENIGLALGGKKFEDEDDLDIWSHCLEFTLRVLNDIPWDWLPHPIIPCACDTFLALGEAFPGDVKIANSLMEWWEGEGGKKIRILAPSGGQASCQRGIVSMIGNMKSNSTHRLSLYKRLLKTARNQLYFTSNQTEFPEFAIARSLSLFQYALSPQARQRVVQKQQPPLPLEGGVPLKEGVPLKGGVPLKRGVPLQGGVPSKKSGLGPVYQLTAIYAAKIFVDSRVQGWGSRIYFTNQESEVVAYEWHMMVREGLRCLRESMDVPRPFVDTAWVAEGIKQSLVLANHAMSLHTPNIYAIETVRHAVRYFGTMDDWEDSKSMNESKNPFTIDRSLVYLQDEPKRLPQPPYTLSSLTKFTSNALITEVLNLTETSVLPDYLFISDQNQEKIPNEMRHEFLEAAEDFFRLMQDFVRRYPVATVKTNLLTIVVVSGSLMPSRFRAPALLKKVLDVTLYFLRLAVGLDTTSGLQQQQALDAILSQRFSGDPESGPHGDSPEIRGDSPGIRGDSPGIGRDSLGIRGNAQEEVEGVDFHVPIDGRTVVGLFRERVVDVFCRRDYLTLKHVLGLSVMQGLLDTSIHVWEDSQLTKMALECLLMMHKLSRLEPQVEFHNWLSTYLENIKRSCIVDDSPETG